MTVFDRLLANAENNGDEVAFGFLTPNSSGEPLTTITHADLAERVCGTAADLLESARPGDRVMIACSPGLDYIVNFFGCLAAGLIAVPAYAPTGTRHLERLRLVEADCAPVLQILDDDLLPKLAGPAGGPRLRAASATGTRASEPPRPGEHPPRTAFLQYTSGSTGAPKGVVVTHANLLANAEASRRTFRIDTTSRVTGWLPPFHDMGLIGLIVTPAVVGCRSDLMSPISFLRDPLVWLRTISEIRGTHSPAPDFAFRLCVDRVRDEDIDSLDLSSWTHALDGAEPVSADCLDAFAERFAPAKFRREAFHPCYGMAETTLLISGARPDGGPVRILTAARDALDRGVLEQVPTPTGDDPSGSVRLVSCGRPEDEATVRIVDSRTRRPVPDGTVGEIWVRSPSVTDGYHEKPEETGKVFGLTLDDGTGPFLATGDLGLLDHGEVFVTGRVKDVLIVNGRNIYPQDLETVARRSEVTGAGRAAAFAVQDPDRIVVVAEVSDRRAGQESLLAARRFIAREVAAECEMAEPEVVLVRAGRLPVTSSGKIQRSATRAAYLDGTLAGRIEIVEPEDTPAPATDRRALDLTLEAVSAVTGRPKDSFDVRAPLSSTGIDSIKAIEITGRLSQRLGFDVPAALAWESSSIADFAARAVAPARSEPAASEPAAPVTAPASAAADAEGGQILVAGIGCRFPGGVRGPDDLWQLLTSGGSGVREVPADRWDLRDVYAPPPGEAGRTYSRHGGFLDSVDTFDAALFGLSAPEATEIDPQHRLLLEVTWEALENAGIAPDALAGTRTGVFVGLSGSDYERVGLARPGVATVDAYAATGCPGNFAANRISYLLGLRGPSLVVDTACSSSLTALHLARLSLEAGECDLAIVGGVQLMLSPEPTIALSQGQMLSASGACHVFADDADGYVRGEGCGVVVLRRRDAAVRATVPARAALVGSAVNQDGRSNGLTAPNGTAQEQVVAEALRSAGLEPRQIGYVEAHGTGTPLGDPVEVRALSRVFADRPGPLPVGSIKANIGHLEAAAGIAGLIKAVLVVEHGQVPAQPTFDRLNPRVDWDAINVTVARAAAALEPGGPRYAGVSSFGFGGANAHAVVAGVTARPSEAGPPDIPVVVKVSGATPGAVADNAERLADALDARPGLPLPGVAATALLGRADLAERIAVVGSDPAGLAGSLREAAGQVRSRPGPARAARSRPAPRVGFLAPGHGSPAAGALIGLYGVDDTITRTIDSFGDVSEWPLRVLVDEGAESAERMLRTDVAQPVHYALAMALADFLATAGVRPEALLGHSVGAFAAAALAGVLEPAAGYRLVRARGDLMQNRCPEGAMAALLCSDADLAQDPAIAGGDVVIAVRNSATDTVVAGPVGEVEALQARARARGVHGSRLAVSRAFHTVDMEPVLDDFTEAVRQARPQPPARTLVSDHDGGVLTALPGPDYWRRHTREAVHFGRAAGTFAEQVDIVVELGPRMLLGLLARAVPGTEPAMIPALAPGRGPEGLLDAVAALWRAHVPVRWDALTGGAQGVALPTYAFDTTRFWVPGDRWRTTLSRTAGAPEEPAPEPPASTPARPAPLAEAPPPAAPAHPGAADPGTARPADRAALMRYLRARLAEALEIADEESIPLDTGMFELGLTSVMVASLRQKVETDLGVQVAITAVFEHPTVRRFAGHLESLGAVLQQTPAVAGAEPSTRPATTPEPEEPTVDETDQDRDIAIIGMACRLPGGVLDLGSFWSLIRAGEDATGPVPEDRWVDEAFDRGDSPLVRWGGYLRDGVRGFDANAFGISPREASAMDPQQRMLLEVAWEALDNAGLRRADLRDSSTAVYIGQNTADYSQLVHHHDVTRPNPYLGTGNTMAVSSGRIAFLLGTHGPAVTVDTACSSALVACDLAIARLRSGDSDLAIVGSANALLTAATSRTLTDMGALSPDGRSKPFDAAADGYGRGEGCGVVVLKRLRDAVRDGDRVWARIRGSAVNHDGSSAGLTVPNQAAQMKAVAAALRDARVTPEEVTYVETHGTGTPLGDPIELSALNAALRPNGGPDLHLGAAKANVGHLEGAAGMVGLIKLALCLHHGEIPPLRRFSQPTPHFDWARAPLVMPASAQTWPAGRPRTGTISALGFSGTNAHLVLSAAPTAPEPPAGPGRRALLLSARTPDDLRRTAQRYADHLRADGASWPGTAWTAAGLDRERWRAAVVADGPGQALDRLDHLVRGDDAPGVWTGQAPDELDQDVVLVFGGSGTEWSDMVAVAAEDPVARRSLEASARVMRRLGAASLLDGGWYTTGRMADRNAAVAAVQVALLRSLTSRGLTYQTVLGFSAGEMAALAACGSVTDEEAVVLAHQQGEVLDRGRGLGATTALGLGADAVRDLIGPAPETEIGVVAVAGAANTTVAGSAERVAELERRARAHGAWVLRLSDDIPLHSPRLTGLAGTHHSPGVTVRAAAPGVRLVRVAAPLAGVPVGDGDWWVEELAQPLNLADAVREAITRRSVVLEISPTPALIGGVQDFAEPGLLDLLRSVTQPGATAREELVGVTAQLHAHGVDLAPDAAAQPTAKVSLPTRVWSHSDHWLGDPISPQAQLAPQAPALAGQAYEVAWTELDLPERSGAELAQNEPLHWLVVGAGTPLQQAVAEQLTDFGLQAQALVADDTSQMCSRLASALRETGRRTGVALITEDLLSPDGDELAAMKAVLPVVQTVLRQEVDRSLWLVTRGATTADGDIDVDAGAIWALGRTIALEAADAWGGMIDLPLRAGDPLQEAEQVTDCMLIGSAEDQTALRDGRRLVCRLLPVEVGPISPPRLSGHGSYLITGGRGSLGQVMAGWLADRGVRHIVLTGRTHLPDLEAAPADLAATVTALRDRGVTVYLPAADVGRAEDVDRLFDADQPWPPIRGVVHLAGVLDHETLTELTHDRIVRSWRPKVDGGRHLVAQAARQGLDFVLFGSSVSSVWGSTMIAPYIIANYGLDVLAEQARARGLPVTGVNWGWWEGTAMAAPVASLFTSMGLGSVRPAVGASAHDLLVQTERSHLVVADADWETFVSVVGARRPRPMFDVVRGSGTRGRGVLAARLAESNDEERLDVVLDIVLAEVGSVLGRDPADPVAPTRPFFELGMDSVASLELKTRLENLIGEVIPASAVFENPSAARLSEFLLAHVDSEAATRQAEPVG